MRWQRVTVGFFALLLAASPNCSKKEDRRYRISGSVKFNDQPMPFGEVLFTPDAAKNNSGPQGIAYIRDGRFDTSLHEGKGWAGGPTVVRVTGLSRQEGGVICEYEYSVDLPRGDTTHDIIVPDSELKKDKRGDI